MKAKTALVLTAAVAAGLVISNRRRRQRRFSFFGKTVVITGGSRGLGLVIARRLAADNARIALLARDGEELRRAESALAQITPHVMGVECDVRREEEVNHAIQMVAERFGSIDVLINNAGIIQVGPVQHMTVADFENAMAVHLFGPLYATLAALPYMRQSGSGRIVNIASVGGKLTFPHLLPYTTSKFALVGLSQGLRAELARENIWVTTVCPGLMRTGSTRNALFKGNFKSEHAWFAISDSMPLLSISAERAAAKIIAACRRGSACVTLGLQTRGAILFNELFPETSASLLALANRLLPGHEGAEDPSTEIRPGHAIKSMWAPSFLTRLSDRAARRNNQDNYADAS